MRLLLTLSLLVRPLISMLAKKFIKKNGRAIGGMAIIAAIALWLIAPGLHGTSDEAAWVQLFMLPTLGLCILSGILLIVFKNVTLSYVLFVIFFIHLLISFGFHPR